MPELLEGKHEVISPIEPLQNQNAQLKAVGRKLIKHEESASEHGSAPFPRFDRIAQGKGGVGGTRWQPRSENTNQSRTACTPPRRHRPRSSSLSGSAPQLEGVRAGATNPRNAAGEMGWGPSASERRRGRGVGRAWSSPRRRGHGSHGFLELWSLNSGVMLSGCLCYRIDIRQTN